MFTKIIDLLSGEIVVNVTPERFTFKRHETEKDFMTKLYLSLDEKPRVLGVGDELMSPVANICIELFKSDIDDKKYIWKDEILDAFFKHAVRAVTNRAVFLRPRIVFIGAQTLNDVLCGYQYSILKKTAMNAGARECVFEN